jgi:hypothetical protein
MAGIEGFQAENENSEELLSDIREISPEVADVDDFQDDENSNNVFGQNKNNEKNSGNRFTKGLRRFVTGAALGAGILAGEGAINQAEAQQKAGVEAVAVNQENLESKLEKAIEAADISDFEVNEYAGKMLKGKEISIVTSARAIKFAAKTIKGLQSIGMKVSYSVDSKLSGEGRPTLNYKYSDLEPAESLGGILKKTLGHIDLDSTSQLIDLELIIK